MRIRYPRLLEKMNVAEIFIMQDSIAKGPDPEEKVSENYLIRKHYLI